MTVDELASELLSDALGSLRGEYMDKLILAARENRGDDVDHAATWIAVLDDVTGAVAAQMFERTTGGGGLGAVLAQIVERAETQ